MDTQTNDDFSLQQFFDDFNDLLSIDPPAALDMAANHYEFGMIPLEIFRACDLKSELIETLNDLKESGIDTSGFITSIDITW